MHFFPPHIGGMEEVARAQASSLARRGQDVTVLTCAHSRGLARREAADSFAVRRVFSLNLFERRFGVTFPLIGPVGAVRIARSVFQARTVHIHDVFYLSSHVAFAAALLLRRRYFLTQHVALVDHPSRLVMAAQRLAYGSVGGAMLRRAEHVVVYNARVRDFVVSLGVDPVRVLMNHNGIDTEVFSPVAGRTEKEELRRRYGLPVDRPVVLFVGRLVPKKGCDLVMNAACPDYTTLVVGDGAPVTTDPGPDVVMFGPATREQLVDLYRLSDVFVFPAIGEMFTLVMQEAMAAGLPVVTSEDSAYGEYGLDGHMIAFAPRDAAAIRRAVTAIVTDPARAAAMGRYARRLAEERFSWEANYGREYAVYGHKEEDVRVAGLAG